MKKLLVVVDYQKDFVDGSLGFEKAKGLENRIYNKIKKYKENEDYVLFTYDTHYDNYFETREGKHLPIKHCINNTDGHELYGRIKDFKNYGDHIKKESFSIDSKILNWLDEDLVDSIEIIGIVTNLCVISNAITFQTLFKNKEITIDASCCASFDDNLHEKALDVMQGLQMNIINRNKGDK